MIVALHKKPIVLFTKFVVEYGWKRMKFSLLFPKELSNRAEKRCIRANWDTVSKKQYIYRDYAEKVIENENKDRGYNCIKY
jgi:hypothetical protein